MEQLLRHWASGPLAAGTEGRSEDCRRRELVIVDPVIGQLPDQELFPFCLLSIPPLAPSLPRLPFLIRFLSKPVFSPASGFVAPPPCLRKDSLRGHHLKARIPKILSSPRAQSSLKGKGLPGLLSSLDISILSSESSEEQQAFLFKKPAWNNNGLI